MLAPGGDGSHVLSGAAVIIRRTRRPFHPDHVRGVYLPTLAGASQGAPRIGEATGEAGSV